MFDKNVFQSLGPDTVNDNVIQTYETMKNIY